jgi:putative membrane protein
VQGKSEGFDSDQSPESDNRLKNRMHRFNVDILVPGLAFLTIGVWSLIQPYDLLTWFLEATPVLIIFFIVAAVYRRFRFTSLSYWLLAVGGILVMIGAHYTYARVPLFEWMKEPLMLQRNHYDRFGHFFQGFVPAIVFRELLLRTSSLKRGTWLFIVVVALCMAKSVLYEFAEWWTALIVGGNAHDFLAMQGDEWDAQTDMFWATMGSIAALMLLCRWHDRQLARLETRKSAPLKSSPHLTH